MTSVLCTRLTLPALAAATSLIAIAAPAQAQSVCSSGTLTVVCTNGTGTIAVDATTVLVPTLQGVSITDPDTLAATVSGTLNANSGLRAGTIASVGDLTVTSGANGALNVVATGTGSGLTLRSTSGTVTATLGTIATVNNYGLVANSADGATVTTGAITATDINTVSVPVPAVGVSVGTAAAVTATTGNAALTINGPLTVSGSAAPLIGAVAIAPAGTATATVNGAVNVTGTSGNEAVGVAAAGSTGASVTVTGTTTLSATNGTALAALTDTGTASINCANVTATGSGVTGVFLRGPTVTASCGNIAVTGANSTGFEVLATTAATANLGTVSATGANSTAVRLENTTGPITLTTGALSTNGANSPALFVTGGTGAVQLTTGAVTTLGATSAGVVAGTGTGNLGINTGLVTTTGVGVFARTGNGNQTITVAGAQSGANAIDAQALGTGNIAVTTTAPVASTAGLGIRAQTATGTILVNQAGATGTTGGVLATTLGTGNVTVNATGGLTTSTGGDAIQLATLGTASTTVGAGAIVQNQLGFDAIQTSGTVANTVTVNGNLGGSGSGYVVNAAGGATTITVGSAGQLAGQLNLTGNNDTLTSAGLVTLSGTSEFGAGTDTFTSNGGLVLTNGAVVNGLETLTLGSNAGLTVNGTTTLGGTTLNNAGTVTSTSGAGTLAGLVAFNNTGTISLVDGAANDSLTINAPYNGSGPNARLAVDVDGNLNAADTLFVNGNITGSTQIDVNLVGSTPLYNPTGVVIVDGSGTVSTGAFTLAPADVQSGFLNFGLNQSGNNTLLVSTLDPSFTDIALLGSLGQEMWYQSFDAYHDAIMGRHSGSLTSGNAIGLWGQLYESKDRYGDSGQSAVINGTTVSFSDQLRTHRRGGQVGIEYRGPGFVIGATGGYEWARSEEQPIVARLKAEGHNYGAYALFGMASGLYGGVMIKRDDYKVNFANAVRGVSFRNDAHSTGVDGEVGFKTVPASGGIGFDLNAGLSYVKSDIDPWNQYGLTFDWEDHKSMRGRLGARVLFPAAWGAFVGAKVFHEFKDDGYLSVRNSGAVADIDMAHRGTWVRLEGGLGGVGSKGAMFTVWGDLGDTKSFGGRVGFQF